MLKRLVSVVLAVLLVMTVFPAFTTYASDNYETVLNNVNSYLVGSTADLSDQDVMRLVTDLSDNGQTAHSALNKNAGRTYLWSDLASGSQADMNSNCKRLRDIALALKTPDTQLYQNSSVKNDLLSALDWFMRNQYAVTVNDWYSGNKNWWYFEIGIPMNLVDILVLLRADITSANMGYYTTCVNKFCPSPLYKACNPSEPETGTNLIWKAYIVAVNAALMRSDAKLSEASSAAASTLSTVTKGDGFYEDGSFIMHGRHPYNGGYGKAFFTDGMNLVCILQGTPFAFSAQEISALSQIAKEAFYPLMYKGSMMAMVRGREVSRNATTDHQAGHEFLRGLVRLCTINPNDQELKQIVSEMITGDTSRNFYKGCGAVSVCNAAKAIVAETPAAPKSMYKQYYHMDKAVAKKKFYSFGISMSSARIYAFETINQENTKGWYQGSGATYIYNDDLLQYDNNYWCTVNPYRLAGTTVDTMPRINAQGGDYLSGKKFTGGVELADTLGISAMYLDADGSSLEAKKSWFVFDDEIVCLGSDIRSNETTSAETIVENRPLNYGGYNNMLLDDVYQSTDLGWGRTVTNPRYVYLVGNSQGRTNIGYYFPKPLTLNLLREERFARWYYVNQTNTSQSFVNNKFLTMYIDHGIKPDQAEYAYVLLPGKSIDDMKTYAASPEIEILQQTDNIHCVKERNNTVGAVFWKMGGQADIIKSSGKSAVMTKWDDTAIEISVSDPTAIGDRLYVEIDKAAAGLVSKDDQVSVVQTSPAIKLSIDTTSHDGRTYKAKLNLAK